MFFEEKTCLLLSTFADVKIENEKRFIILSAHWIFERVRNSGYIDDDFGEVVASSDEDDGAKLEEVRGQHFFLSHI